MHFTGSQTVKEKAESFSFCNTATNRKMTGRKVQIFINVGQGGVFCEFVLCWLTHSNSLALLLREITSPFSNSFSVPL